MKNKFSIRDTQSASTLQRFNSLRQRSGAAKTGPRFNTSTLQRFSQPHSAFRIPHSAFTLVELLIVIATIGILAALLMPVFHSVTIHSVLQRAQSERAQIETAIQNYFSDRGYYPPGNTASPQNRYAALTNQLYYELEGTTTNNAGPGVAFGQGLSFTTLDRASTVIAVPAMRSAFGVSSFMNYTKGSAEDSKPAKNYLPGLPAARMATNTMLQGYFIPENTYMILVTAANSDPNYKPLPGILTLTGANANPWRYLCPGVHNPNSYDLWIQIFIGGKTNLICNWKTDPEVNPALP